MTFFSQLQTETRNQRQDFLSTPVLQDGIAGNISLETYISFLTQAYHHVKHTIPLLMACGSRLPERLEWLRVSVGEYIEEEMGHQEWILNDINACGVDAEVIRCGIADSATDINRYYGCRGLRHYSSTKPRRVLWDGFSFRRSEYCTCHTSRIGNSK